MLRLITSRRVRLALATVALVAAVVAVARLWRRAEDRRTALPVEGSRNAFSTEEPGKTSPPQGPGSEAGHAPRWPSTPILGTPTDEDLRRYAARPPSAVRSAVERMFERGPRTPREPLDRATRGRLVRWGAVGVGLCLLAFGTQALESAVFSNGTETVEATDSRSVDEECEPEPDTLPEPGSRYPAYTEGTLRVVRCVDAEEFQHIEQLYSDMDRYPQPTDPVRPYETPVPHETAGTPMAVPDADCHPRARAPRVRAVDPRVTRAVNRQWRRIERWLKTNAHASLRTLDRPARPRTIAVAEAQMGLRLPDDLRASLLRHDGASFVAGTWPFGFFGHGNHGVREIRDTWRWLCEVDGEVRGDAGARAESWDGRMIPFGGNGSGDHLVIDSVVRDVGATDHEGTMSFAAGGTRIGSYYRLLRATADAMETGGSVGRWKPEVVDGELDWNVVER
ncbi:SMI1/KNR4 family protein [Streptosporangium sp. NPDC002721]|uniref:SMI1/KNR4 family protein n=1 Tax=Streptosporangium sp. NPDC002721 TaxID=3366188 RepID=UPI0036B09C87